MLKEFQNLDSEVEGIQMQLADHRKRLRETQQALASIEEKQSRANQLIEAVSPLLEEQSAEGKDARFSKQEAEKLIAKCSEKRAFYQSAERRVLAGLAIWEDRLKAIPLDEIRRNKKIADLKRQVQEDSQPGAWY